MCKLDFHKIGSNYSLEDNINKVRHKPNITATVIYIYICI